MAESGNGRPARRDVERAALGLFERHHATILRTAHRYSATAEDAEDACQRALEILLTKAPSADEEDLLPWLRTVVKHEAFALRRQRERTSPAGDGETLVGAAGHAGGTEDQVERYERLRVGAEALRRLKPQEIRCLLLRAEGYSYRQICEATGFSYTKVNRCLTEGRQSFLARIEGIESGVECERLAPILSALADGEAGAADMAALRPHLRGCLACRATLKRYRATPVRVAALLPVGALAGEPDAWSPAGEAPGLVSRALEATGSWLQERAGAMSLKVQSAADRVQQVAEAGSAQKAAAVAASTAALAGGGVASVRTLDPGVGRDRADTRERSDEGRERVAETPLAGAPAPPPVPAAPPPEQSEAEVTAREPPSAPDPEPAAEFAPGPAATVSATAAAPRGTSSAPAPPHRGHESSGGGSAGGAGEFGP